MSGLEIFGAIVTSLDATIVIISAVHEAVSSAKDLPKLLEEYEEECRMSKVIIESIKDRPSLQKRDVNTAVLKVGSTVTALDQHLRSLDQGRGRFHEIGHQLLSGSQERKKLKKLMDRLTRGKDNLIAIITILASQSSAPATRRIVRDNRASGRARQFNAPFIRGAATEDPWKDIHEVIVERNIVSDQATQLNTAMTSESLKLLLKTLAEDEQREVDAELQREASEVMDLRGIWEGANNDTH